MVFLQIRKQSAFSIPILILVTLDGCEISVVTTKCHQFIVRTRLTDMTFIQHIDAVISVSLVRTMN